MDISKKLPIYISSILLIIIVVLITTTLFAKIAGELTLELSEKQLIEKARSQVDMAENIADYIGQQQDNRVFTLSRPKRRRDFINAIPSSDNEFLHGMKATQIISNMFRDGNHLVNIRVTSESPINPNNSASQKAIEVSQDWKRLSQGNSESDFFEIKDGKAYYFRPIYHTSRNCIKCHGDFQSAPVDIKNTFPTYTSGNNLNQFLYTPDTGFGYRVNDLAGFYEATFDAPNQGVWEYLFNHYLTELLFFIFIISTILYFVVDKLFASHIREVSVDLNAISNDEDVDNEKYTVSGNKGELGVLNDAMSRISTSYHFQKEKIEEREALLMMISNGVEIVDNKTLSIQEEADKIALYERLSLSIKHRIFNLLKRN